MNELDDLVVDDASIGVVDGTVTTNEELRSLFASSLGGQMLPEEGVGIDNVGDPFGRVEAGDLDDIVALGPLELLHLLFDAKRAEFAHVVRRVPRGEFLVQAIKPGAGVSNCSQCRKIRNNLTSQ